jgi:hypothetical protein
VLQAEKVGLGPPGEKGAAVLMKNLLGDLSLVVVFFKADNGSLISSYLEHPVCKIVLLA